MGEALIIDGVRTPRGKGKPNGSLHEIHPQELLAQVLNALVERNGFDPEHVDELERRDQSTALVAMCTGGGMGTATIIERV
jgi:acetyl-CoA acetyltransferase